MQYEIISIGLGGNGQALLTLEAENKYDALNRYAEIKGLAPKTAPDERWFELRHSYAAAPLGTAEKSKKHAQAFAESLKVYVPKNTHELHILTGLR